MIDSIINDISFATDGPREGGFSIESEETTRSRCTRCRKYRVQDSSAELCSTCDTIVQNYKEKKTA